MGIKNQLPYFVFIAWILAEIGNAIIEFGLFEARRRHSLIARRCRNGNVGRVEARLNKRLARFRCNHWLKLSRCKRVNVSSL